MKKHRLFKISACLAVVVVATGCSARSPAQPPSTTVEAAVVSSSTTAATLPEVTAYEPLPGEVEQSAKREASRLVTVVTGYRAGDGTFDGLRRRLVNNGFSAAFAGSAEPLADPSASSAGQVLYAQFGGLTKREASVMVIVRQTLLRGPRVDVLTRTIDVRLSRKGTVWTSTGFSVPTRPVRRVPLSSNPPVVALLTSERVELPDTARWDLAGGIVDGRVVGVLLELSEQFQISVSVFATGHPIEVFGTSRQSNHTAGRGVDIWKVDGVPVIAQRTPDSAANRLVKAVLTLGPTEVGSPWDLDGPRAPSFTNALHQDHIHIAFDR